MPQLKLFDVLTQVARRKHLSRKTEPSYIAFIHFIYRINAKMLPAPPVSYAYHKPNATLKIPASVCNP